jgi:hydroxypyruvate isomerase
MLRFAANLSFLSPALPFLEHLEAAARLGFYGRTPIALAPPRGFDAQRAL